MSRQIMDSLQHQYRGITHNTPDMFTIAGFINHYNGPQTIEQNFSYSIHPLGLMWAFKYMPPYPGLMKEHIR
jgi:hypothetical protein